MVGSEGRGAGLATRRSRRPKSRSGSGAGSGVAGLTGTYPAVRLKGWIPRADRGGGATQLSA